MKVENLECLVCLFVEIHFSRVSIRTSSFFSIPKNLAGTLSLVNLTELYLSENGIEKIEHLDSNTKLETLGVTKNRIKMIENVGHLESMEEFWANDNEISSWKCVDEPNTNIKLETVYLERNLSAKDVQYRKKLTLAVPWLKKIDATLCTHN